VSAGPKEKASAAAAGEAEASAHNVGVLNERALHASLKEWYAQAGDRAEAPVDRYTIDLVRGDLLIEFQTGNFGAMKQKLARLLQRHAVRLVYPVAAEKWIVRMEGEKILGRRKSPKRGSVYSMFHELVSMPHLVREPGLTIEVLLIQEEERRVRATGRRAWRRNGWTIAERRLVGVVESRQFNGPKDYLALLPEDLPERFTTADLAEATGQRRHLAQRMAYCLRGMGACTIFGKEGNARVYERAAGD
jgi:hypothetical protein